MTFLVRGRVLAETAASQPPTLPPVVTTLCETSKTRVGMSVEGQSRRFGDVRATSVLPFIADVRWEDRQVRKVPHPVSCSAASIGQIVDAVSRAWRGWKVGRWRWHVMFPSCAA